MLAASTAATAALIAFAVRSASRPAFPDGRARVGGRRRVGSRLPWIAAALAGVAAGLAPMGPTAAVAGACGVLGAGAYARRRRRRRLADLLERQLADAVDAIGAALRAGESLSRATAYAASESEPPLSESLREVVRREALGEPLADAIERWADAVGTDDARLVGASLRLHSRTGGDLPRVLDGVARTLRERGASAREVRALTAQARLSGAILGTLPIGFFLFLLVTSRSDIEAAFRTPVGVASVAVGLLMQALAFAWIRALLRVA